MATSIEVSRFLGLLVALWLYGMFCCMILFSIGSLWERRHRSKVPIIVTACLVVLCTAKALLFSADGYLGFIDHGDDPTAYWSGYNGLILQFNDYVSLLEVSIVDSFLCWRLYVIWSRKLAVVVLPSALIFLETALALALVLMTSVKHDAVILYASDIQILQIACTVCGVSFNLIVTPLIAARLWWTARTIRRGPARRLYRTIIARLIESGALYTTVLVLWDISVVTTEGTTGFYWIMDRLHAMTAGIAPMMLIIKLNKSALGMQDIEFSESSSDPEKQASLGLKAPSMGAVSTTIEFRTPPPL